MLFRSFDALTGLPNRLLLADRLHQAMAQARRRGQGLAVAYLDLDGFKAINDTHGHAVGDQLLVTVADHLKQTLREGDTLARLLATSATRTAAPTGVLAGDRG